MSTNSKQSHIEVLFLLSREAQGKSLLDEYHEQRQALSKYCIGALLLTEPIISVVRRELKRLSPDVRIEVEEIHSVLSIEVIKREVLDGDKAQDAERRIARAANRALRTRSEREPESSISKEVIPTIVAQVP